MRIRPGHVLSTLLLSTAVAVTTGCTAFGGGSSLRSESLGENAVSLDLASLDAVYGIESEDGDASFYLTDIPVEDLLAGNVERGQVLHVELLWRPHAGSTPMDASATNASIRHVIIVDGEVGVYGGAGFAMPSGDPGDKRLRLSLEDTDVRLLESTGGFQDLLGPARLRGAFSAKRDELAARKVHRAVSQLVTNAFGGTRFVMGGHGLRR